jgi:dTDP-4-dehydrorhamnose reductase
MEPSLDEPLQLWGGLECTVNRVHDQYHCQQRRNGHLGRPDDIERFGSLGIRAIRYPVLWESVAPHGLRRADWSLPDERLPLLREQGVEPIVGLVHHGSGPRHTSLLDSHFAPQLAAFALQVAKRYPWVSHYTPVNEPMTTARFSALYGVWFPHARSERAFIRALLNQCRAVVLCMAAVRSVNPAAQLVQTDDLGISRGTPPVQELVELYNHRRWLGWDLLCGLVDRSHPLWSYLVDNGAQPQELSWFLHHACPPDVIGVNHYITSDRWVDHRVELYPESCCGSSRVGRVADVEAVRAHHEPPGGIAPLLREAWERYGRPLAVTEAHIDARREDQLRWLLEIWQAAQQLRREGADVRAVTVWALLGSFDWNCLVTQCRGHYEPGPFDVRGPRPRPTALARLMRQLAAGEAPDEPVLQGHGWWRRPRELLCRLPAPGTAQVVQLDAYRAARLADAMCPILVVAGRLGPALAATCATRPLHCVTLEHHELAGAGLESIQRALDAHRPWAVIHTGALDADQEAGYPGLPPRDAALLAQACRVAGVRLLHFSGADVFDGNPGPQAVESDPPCPASPMGRAMAEAERAVLQHCPDALVIRSGPVIGPADDTLLDALLGEGDRIDDALQSSLTHLPDLLDTGLDLLIDHEQGIWHMAHADSDWRAALLQCLRDASLDVPAAVLAQPPRTPRLATERGLWLPPLAQALGRWMPEAVERCGRDASAQKDASA